MRGSRQGASAGVRACSVCVFVDRWVGEAHRLLGVGAQLDAYLPLTATGGKACLPSFVTFIILIHLESGCLFQDN